MEMMHCQAVSMNNTLTSNLSLRRFSMRASNRLRCLRSVRLQISNKLVLVPSGDGSTDHLGVEVTTPGQIELKEGLYELGREQPADIVIPVPTVSARHAMVKVENGKLIVTDLGSTNGTYINGEQVPAMKATGVAVGGEVIFGDMFLAKFQVTEEPDPAMDVESAPAAEAFQG